MSERREIKFRAWVKHGNLNGSGYMGQVKIMSFDFDTVLVETNYYKFSELELLQYTGLKDKNGKEIYEGDILKDKHGYNKIVEWEYHEDNDVTEWAAGFWFDYEANEYLVISNIYENPELLGK